jgi:hypothetical protein
VSYSAVRKPSLIGRLGSLIGSGAAVVVIWWLLFVGIRNARTPDALFWVTAGLIVSFAIAVCVHEAGHLVVGLALGEPVRKIRIGSGPTLLGTRLGGIVIQICANPLSGGAVSFSGLDSTSRGRRIATLIAGPGANLLAAAYAFGFAHFGAAWLGTFGVANVVLFVAGAMPSTSVQGGRAQPSDGLQLFILLFRPPARSAYFEGAEMTASAQAVLIHALEDAQIAGALEVTDDHLLRALNRDAALGDLFATVDLSSRLPPGGTPESSDSHTPTWSAMALAILETAFRKARDMGQLKPNAAGICLGLLAVECPASRLLKDAGITEGAVARLAAIPTDAQDGARGSVVINPDMPLERWGTAADKPLALAYRIAAADHSQMVGTQHIVAALNSDPESRSARVLARLGFVLVRREGKPTFGVDVKADEAAPLLSPQAVTAIAGALQRTGLSYPCGSIELCLGILDQGAGIGAQILASAGVTVATIEKTLRLVPRDQSDPAGCTTTSWPMWQIRASARMGAGRWVEARDDFLVAERVVSTDEQRALCRNNAAWASLMSGDATLHATALELSRVALAVQPDRPAFIGTYAFALLENGSPSEAAALLEPVAAKHPRPRDRASDLCLLAICQARLQHRDAAAKNLQAAREADPKCALLGRAEAELAGANATLPAS